MTDNELADLKRTATVMGHAGMLGLIDYIETLHATLRGRGLRPDCAEVACGSCGAVIEVGVGHRTRRTRYCGDACRQRAFRTRKATEKAT